MSVANPIEGFLDLIELRETLETTARAQKGTQDALRTLKKFEAQMDVSTIKKVEAQLKKMETAVAKAKKALSIASKKKLPQELKDFYNKEIKVLKKTLPASVFGSPTYSYSGSGVGYGSFYIKVPLQDYKHIIFVLKINYEEARAGHRGWAGWVPSTPARVVTKTYLEIEGEFGERTSESVLEFLKNNEYAHYPNIANIQALKEIERSMMERDLTRLPRWARGEIQESRGQLYIEVEARTDMRWEYDQEHMNLTEWEERAESVINNSIEKIKKILPNYEYSSGGMGEKGYYYITLKPKQ